MAAMSATDEILARMEVTMPNVEQKPCHPFRSNHWQSASSRLSAREAARVFPAALGKFPQSPSARPRLATSSTVEYVESPQGLYGRRFAGICAVCVRGSTTRVDLPGVGVSPSSA
jgi:hypothetical protein